MSVLLAAALLATAPLDTSATRHCRHAAEFLRATQRMEVEVVADSLNDWRSRTRVAGCTVTAAGASDLDVRGEATRLYERIRTAGWERTPDPRDAPREASLRFRREGSDCLFNVNAEAMLFTDAEERVLERLTVRPGEVRYHVYVMCFAAMPSAERP